MAQGSDITVFDPGKSAQLLSPGGPGGGFTFEQIAVGDWTKSLSAGGKIDFAVPSSAFETFGPESIAESWTMPSPGVWVFKVRQGVHWALDPNNEASRLMNGREMTADDWVSNWNYLSGPSGSLKANQPVVVATTTVEKTGPWEVTIKHSKQLIDAWLWVETGGGCYNLLPPEVVKKYGNVGEWRNVVGTGPFMIADFVPGSAITYKRNPNYWGKDPAGPGKGNQIPYIDGLKILIIPDVSTRVAALRTAKIDVMNGMETGDAKSIMQTTPGLKDRGYFNSQPYSVAMRTDKPDLPFKDKRVRQALLYATDLNAMAQQLYGGDSKLFTWPVDSEMTPDLYIPLEQLPQNVQDLYKYNPDKAKALLKEAGYPNGFKTKMVAWANGVDTDTAAIYKAMWAKVGVDVTIDPKETGVFNSIMYSKGYDETFLRWGWTFWSAQYMMAKFHSESNFDNASYVDIPNGSDPFIDGIYERVSANIFVDWGKANQALKELTPYVLEQAYYIPRPSPRLYNFWWPWVKNMSGEPQSLFMKYHWIDQDLKSQVSGK